MMFELKKLFVPAPFGAYRMRRCSFLLLMYILCGRAVAQEPSLNARTIADLLDTSQNQWVFNHICVPKKLLAGRDFTQGEFIDAYLIVSRRRWEAAQEALGRDDEKASMKPLASLIHGVIDSYWPGRVVREKDGSIISFRDCDELGNLQGMLSDEKSGAGPTGEVIDSTTKRVAEVIRKWKERRPFEEVLPLLESGPMKVTAEAAARKLEQR